MIRKIRGMIISPAASLQSLRPTRMLPGLYPSGGMLVLSPKSDSLLRLCRRSGHPARIGCSDQDPLISPGPRMGHKPGTLTAISGHSRILDAVGQCPVMRSSAALPDERRRLRGPGGPGRRARPRSLDRCPLTRGGSHEEDGSRAGGDQAGPELIRGLSRLRLGAGRSYRRCP